MSDETERLDTPPDRTRPIAPPAGRGGWGDTLAGSGLFLSGAIALIAAVALALVLPQLGAVRAAPSASPSPSGSASASPSPTFRTSAPTSAAPTSAAPTTPAPTAAPTTPRPPTTPPAPTTPPPGQRTPTPTPTR
ncbi:MAG TPA: hypothetical protein VFW12_03000 [Candidatus Limnocylindria bacterium]|nr:hypothetical protein [Candidatus Limnocylindria bacterium]